jgi:hypothetical protein
MRREARDVRFSQWDQGKYRATLRERSAAPTFGAPISRIGLASPDLSPMD